MSNSLWVRFRNNSTNNQEDSWWERVSENARAFFESRGTPQLAPSGAATFDLLDARPAPGTRQRQAVSVLVHGCVFAILLLAGRKAIIEGPPRPVPTSGSQGTLIPLNRILAILKPRGAGSGSNNDPLPVTVGHLPPHSPIALVPPKLPDQKPHEMPIPPTIHDLTADMPIRNVTDLGLPWMKDRTNSNGDQGGHTMGTRPGDSAGSTPGRDGGNSWESGPYSAGAYPVVCVYCPNPEYTDEARHEKLQGSVELQVLVSKDGRAAQIRIVKGLGLGLDERAIAAVRNWKFRPARDASKAPIPQWVTVEATYRLF